MGGHAGLEFSLKGPTLRFACAALVSLCGARFAADLDGEPVAWWSSFAVAPGQTLTIGQVRHSHCDVLRNNRRRVHASILWLKSMHHNGTERL